MAGTNFFSAVTSTVSVSQTEENGYAVLAKFTGSLPTIANLFQKGCILIKTDAGNGVVAVFTNKGTLASPLWSAVDGSGETPQSLTGAGAASLLTKVTNCTTTAAGDVVTLADGVEGQEKVIILDTLTTAGHTIVITPTNFRGGTTVTLNAAGRVANMLFTNGAWVYTAGTGTVA